MLGWNQEILSNELMNLIPGVPSLSGTRHSGLWMLGNEHNYMEIDKAQMPRILLTFNTAKKLSPCNYLFPLS